MLKNNFNLKTNIQLTSCCWGRWGRSCSEWSTCRSCWPAVRSGYWLASVYCDDCSSPNETCATASRLGPTMSYAVAAAGVAVRPSDDPGGGGDSADQVCHRRWVNWPRPDVNHAGWCCSDSAAPSTRSHSSWLDSTTTTTMRGPHLEELVSFCVPRCETSNRRIEKLSKKWF